MDAQNAPESSSTKQPASPKGSDSDSAKSKPSSSLAKDPKSATATSDPTDEDVAPDQNSDAETIVLPGKDGISPSKPRKVIKHEDKSDEEMNDIPQPRKQLKDMREHSRNSGHSDDSTTLTSKKKRHSEKEQQRTKERSGGTSSAPTSPPAHRRNSHDVSHRRHRSGDGQSASESESAKSRSHKSLQKGRVPIKRKAIKTESDDEGDPRQARRPRLSEANADISGARERERQLAKQSRVEARILGALNCGVL
ncbi:hypothetical protein F5Y16DRAFT_181803 [Xylariaceae sp. FL0255]|nr:hypothetical protein F5Y16DRAFT_181803 [Xylariaceae sp. FL0255]